MVGDGKESEPEGPEVKRSLSPVTPVLVGYWKDSGGPRRKLSSPPVIGKPSG